MLARASQSKLNVQRSARLARYAFYVSCANRRSCKPYVWLCLCGRICDFFWIWQVVWVVKVVDLRRFCLRCTHFGRFFRSLFAAQDSLRSQSIGIRLNRIGFQNFRTLLQNRVRTRCLCLRRPPCVVQFLSHRLRRRYLLKDFVH